MVNVRRVIDWVSKWVRDEDSGRGRESERGKEVARDVMEDGRGASPLE